MTHEIKSPEEFFGFHMGTDRKLARWDKIVEYFWHLSKLPTVKVLEVGKSTEGNPFLVAFISSPENIENIERIREISLRLAHPQGLTPPEVDDMISEGKSVVSITCSLHASEIGGTQTAPELAFELATSDSPVHRKIRENTVLVLVPSFNPDGNIMVVDYYNKYLGTEYEGGSLPYLYQKYVGHDNNRDAFQMTQVESKLVSKILYKDWYPQAQVDHHHMGTYGARLSVPPNSDPIFHDIEPLVLAEQQLYGGMILTELEASGMTGIESQCTYSLEGGPFWNHAPLLHCICGMLTESASARMATPIYVHKDQINPSKLGRPENKPQMNFPHPWEGGWWTLRDIVEQIKVSSIAVLKVAANLREEILRNMYVKASHQIELGKTQAPYAYVFPPNQRDKPTMVKLLRNLDAADVRVHRAVEGFEAEGLSYPAGSYVVFTSQVSRPYILRLLKSEYYHDGPWTVANDGSRIFPYDLSTYAQQEFMGVKAVEVRHPLDGSFEPCEEIPLPEGVVHRGEAGYLLDCSVNHIYIAVNRLLAKGITVHRVNEEVSVDSRTLPRGAFYVPNTDSLAGTLDELAADLGLEVHGVDSEPGSICEVKQMRIGLYQRYRGGNMDEGWTRWLLEQFEYGFDTVRDMDVREGLDDYDVLILPSDSKEMLIGENLEEYYKKSFGGRRSLPKYPEEYESALGEEGVAKIKEFVMNGGTLITLNQASDLAIEELDVPVRNTLKDLKPGEFLCPGSTLKARYNMNHKATYGMPEYDLILFKSGAAYTVTSNEKGEDITPLAWYMDKNILQSGWLIGEKHIAEKTPLLEVKKGEGRIILFGFSPQARAQTDNTFKLLFNQLI